MAESKLELADVIRRFGQKHQELFGQVMMPSQTRALRDIADCMTEKMGGGRHQCNQCDNDFWCFHGCRNRSCPKCHGRQTANWLEKREAEMLPCGYFHVIATVPSELRLLFLRHQKILYGLLMKTTADALRDLAANPRYVGAEVGILAVLHTWTSQLHLHPHVHMLVTGGGVTKDGGEWHDAPKDYLVPVKKLSSMIKQRFAEALRKQHPDLFRDAPSEAWKKEWCSFCKPFGEGREAVLRYLARYVFRIAISNARILTMDETHVTFRYKDNDNGQMKEERIPGVDFIRRYLLHVLPKGFHKVRYYGLWHPGQRAKQERARVLLLLDKKIDPVAVDEPVLLADLAEEALKQSECEEHAFVVKCPVCGSKDVKLIETKRRKRAFTVT